MRMPKIIDKVTCAWAEYAKSLLEELILVCGDSIHPRQLIELEEIIKEYKDA